MDWSGFPQVIASLRQAAGGNLRARVRALKETDRLVGRRLHELTGHRHFVRYTGSEPAEETVVALADRLEQLTAIVGEREAVDALRLLHVHLHESIPHH